MSDSYEHEKPYSLAATYQENPAPSTLTAPKVLLVDGTGLVACTSSTPFNVNDRVFVQGNSIVRTASSGSVILVEI